MDLHQAEGHDQADANETPAALQGTVAGQFIHHGQRLFRQLAGDEDVEGSWLHKTRHSLLHNVDRRFITDLIAMLIAQIDVRKLVEAPYIGLPFTVLFAIPHWIRLYIFTFITGVVEEMDMHPWLHKPLLMFLNALPAGINNALIQHELTKDELERRRLEGMANLESAAAQATASTGPSEPESQPSTEEDTMARRARAEQNATPPAAAPTSPPTPAAAPAQPAPPTGAPAAGGGGHAPPPTGGGGGHGGGGANQPPPEPPFDASRLTEPQRQSLGLINRIIEVRQLRPEVIDRPLEVRSLQQLLRQGLRKHPSVANALPPFSAAEIVQATEALALLERVNGVEATRPTAPERAAATAYVYQVLDRYNVFIAVLRASATNDINPAILLYLSAMDAMDDRITDVQRARMWAAAEAFFQAVFGPEDSRRRRFWRVAGTGLALTATILAILVASSVIIIAVVGALLGLIGLVVGLGAMVVTLFAMYLAVGSYFSWTAFLFEGGAAVSWVCCLLVILYDVVAVFFTKNEHDEIHHHEDGRTTVEVVRGREGPIRARALRIRLGISAIALLFTLLVLIPFGLITNVQAAVFTLLIWGIVLIVDIGTNFSRHISDLSRRRLIGRVMMATTTFVIMVLMCGGLLTFGFRAEDQTKMVATPQAIGHRVVEVGERTAANYDRAIAEQQACENTRNQLLATDATFCKRNEHLYPCDCSE